MSDRDFLGEAFDGKSAGEAERFYDDWADSYEQTHIDMGYLAPQRWAAALSKFVADKSAPVLDIGCGTGLSGLALHKQGFTAISGTDLSARMLAKAQRHQGVYVNLFQADLSQGLPQGVGQFSHAVAAGVFSPGHAPAGAIASMIELLSGGGCFSFSLNDHSLADGTYQLAIDELLEKGAVLEVFREHGENVPGTGLFATVVVLKRIG